jgi:class 3 adenylate cyclase/CHASE2 domain-containing sensor protein
VLLWFFVFPALVKPRLKPILPIPVLIGGSVLLIVCMLRLCNWDVLERLERMTFDMRVRHALAYPQPVATNLGFIYINEDTIKAVKDGSLGYSFGLYWPRQIYARLVNELSAQGAKAVAFDVIFGDLRPDHSLIRLQGNQTMESDAYFGFEMQRCGNVVLAVSQGLAPPPLFSTNAAALGDISTDRDSDGILRRARAFRTYRQWHPAFLQAQDDPELGIDLREARLEPGRVVLPRSIGDIPVPLDAQGNFSLADFGGDALPPGTAPTAKPFVEKRVWHMGVILAARELELDLDQAQVQLAKGRITLSNSNGVTRVIPVDASGYFYIDWCLPPNHSALMQEGMHTLLMQNSDRLRGRGGELDSRWRGRLAVVGSSAMGNDLTDRGATPLSADTLLVSKHWNVANSIISNRFVQRSTIWIDLLLIVLLGTFAAVLTWRFRALVAFSLVVGLAAAYLVVAVYIFVGTRYWVPIVIPVGGALLMTYICLVTWRAVFEQAEQRRVKSIFSKMVSPKIVSELLRAHDLKLGGTRREITVLFADVRGFTELTDVTQERVAEYVRQNNLTGAAAEAAFDEQARETLRTVNEYLGLVADTITSHDGTLDKFIGDCVMAFWGAPTANPRHAVQCVRAAIEAQRAIHQLNLGRAAQNERRKQEQETRVAAGLPPQPMLPLLLLGSGINSGMATAGLMGSEAETRNYTVFGREVNLASRLESLSGRGRIFLSEATYAQLLIHDPELARTCVEHPAVNVKGIRSVVKIYEAPWADHPLPTATTISGSDTDATTLISRTSR